jgi:co-chaperonin GroES (HSP10)
MIKAVADKIVVEFLRTATTEAGLILPDMGQDPQGFGKVLSVGSEVENIKEGDILVFHMRAGMDLILNKRVQKCLKYEEVYGVLEDKELESRLESLEFAGKSESTNLVKPARGGVVIAP